MKKTIKLLVLLCVVMTLLGCSGDEQAADYVTVSPNAVSFPYDGGKQDITIKSNTEWTITYIPSWLEVTVKSANGSSTTTLSTTKKNYSVAPFSDKIVVSAGTASETIQVTQNPPVSQDCKTTAVSDMQLVMSYGYATDFEHGSATGSFRFRICTEAESNQLKVNLDKDVEATAKDWEWHSTAERFSLVYDKCEPGQSYHLFTVGYSSSNVAGGYQDFPFTTPRVPATLPTVNITLKADMQQTPSGDAVWQWDAAKKNSCKEFIVYACASPEKFHSYKLAENETDTKRRGLWLAHQIMAKRKMSATTEKSGPMEPNSTLNINFGHDNDRKCNEILYEMMPNDTEGMTLRANPEDRYIEVFTWCVSNTDGQLTSIVSDSIYTIENGRIVTGKDTPPPLPHTTVAPSSLSFEAEADAKGQDINVTSNEEWTAVSDAPSWCAVSPSQGSNNGTVKVTVTANTTAQRTAHITITGLSSGDKTTVTVTQLPPPPPAPVLKTDKDNLNFSHGASNEYVSVTSNVGWTVRSSASWCTVSPTKGDGNGSITVSVTRNEALTPRKATITITADDSSLSPINIEVTQAEYVEIKPGDDDNTVPGYSRKNK